MQIIQFTDKIYTLETFYLEAADQSIPHYKTGSCIAHLAPHPARGTGAQPRTGGHGAGGFTRGGQGGGGIGRGRTPT